MGLEVEIWACSRVMGQEWRYGPRGGYLGLEWRYGLGVEVWAWIGDMGLGWKYQPGVDIWAWSGDMGLGSGYGLGVWIWAWRLGLCTADSPVLGCRQALRVSFPSAQQGPGYQDSQPSGGSKGGLVCLQMDGPSRSFFPGFFLLQGAWPHEGESFSKP